MLSLEQNSHTPSLFLLVFGRSFRVQFYKDPSLEKHGCGNIQLLIGFNKNYIALLTPQNMTRVGHVRSFFKHFIDFKGGEKKKRKVPLCHHGLYHVR